MFKNLVVKDAFRQILGRVASAIGGFLVIKIITPYLGPLRFGDYSTILKYFAIRSAFADFGLYVIALKHLGVIKESGDQKKLQTTYSKFVSTRVLMVAIVYMLALVVAYLIPAYTSNPYLIWGLPLGMLFSASFMTSGIIQIPLQIFWKMEQLSLALILARVFQIAMLVIVVYVLFADIDFATGTFITPFNLVIGSVLLSGVVQLIYVRWKANKILPLKWEWDRSFTKHMIGKNRQYGLAYYLSSFHTLGVLILLSIFFPTIKGFDYAGTWALALGLIEILLIVPSALGNSLIHKVASHTSTEKMRSFGSLLTFILWIGGIIILNFTVFAPHLIYFIGGTDYLATSTQRGSDTLLPFLAIILVVSFIKQVFNYIFVSTDLQNYLLGINLFGVLLGGAIGIPLILEYELLGGLIAQGLLEVLFLAGALYVAWKHSVLPTVSRKRISLIVASTGVLTWLFTTFISIPVDALLVWAATSVALTGALLGLSRNFLRSIMRKL